MKRSIFLIALMAFLSSGAAAQASLPAIDKSPLDLLYYPLRFPNLKVQDRITEPLTARVIYSRPKKEGRDVFGGLVEYGKLWRLGANEATEIEFYKPVTIGGKKVQKGRYTLFAIVDSDTWTFIVNRETDVWGSFKYDMTKDVARVEVPVEKLDQQVESLAMTFEKNDSTLKLVVAWEKIKAALPISL